MTYFFIFIWDFKHIWYILIYVTPFLLQCVSQPLASSYRGGTIANLEFENGMDGWSAFGGSKLEIRSDQGGNRYVPTTERKNNYDSASQKLNLTQDLMYTLAGMK